jgi:dolichyl-phosphate beta-glucosyltransferase
MVHHMPTVGIVIPCYNEEKRIQSKSFEDFLKHFHNIHLCFVNDGSIDKTINILDEIVNRHPNNSNLINLDRNRGKGEAVRAGANYLLSQSSFDLIGYWDADLSTPLIEIPRFIEIFNEFPQVYFVSGSRVLMMGYQIERLWFRHYIGRIFATIVSLFLRLPIYDTQCGAKLIKAKLCGNIFREKFCSKWVFDVELIARFIMLLGYERSKKGFIEVPLKKWQDKGGSKLSFLSIFLILKEMNSVFIKYKQLWNLK